MTDRAIGLVGLAFTIIFGLWSLAPDGWPKMPLWATFLGAGLGIFLVGVAAGLIIGEYRKVPAPSLGLAMDGGNIFNPDALGLVGLGLDIRVWNTGGPTYVTKWSLLIIAPGHIPVVAQLTRIPELLRAGGPLNSAVLRSSKDLSVMTSTQPVKLAPMGGKLLFYAGIDRQSLENAATRLQLTATDSYGTEKRIEPLIGEWMRR
jgi:hypothetical protein